MFEEKDEPIVPTLISIKDRGGLVKAPQHVLDVLLAVESTVRCIVSKQGIIPKDAHAIILTQVLGYVLAKNIHRKFACTIHTTNIIRDIIKRYTKVRLKHEAAKADGPVIRSKMSRVVIYSHV